MHCVNKIQKFLVLVVQNCKLMFCSALLFATRGGLAVELGPGRFGIEGAQSYSSESFAVHSFGRFFAYHYLDSLQMILDSLFTI